MNDQQRAQLDEECLHYLWECHEDPADFEVRLQSDSALAERLEAMRAQTDLLTEAANSAEPIPQFDPPREETPTPIYRAKFFGRFQRIAAALLFFVFILAPCGVWAVSQWRVQNVERDSLRLVVSAPRGVPDGTSAKVHVDTWNLAGNSLAAQIDWEAFDADGRSLAQGSTESLGSFDLEVPANLPGLRRIEVRAQRDGLTRQAEIQLAPDSEAPLIHLTTDKPVYRPGERLLVRLVVLDRLQLEPTEGRCLVRIVDGKNAIVYEGYPTLEQGVGDVMWMIPPGQRGGEYRIEVRDSKNEFAVESLDVLIRRFQAPVLKKSIDLDRETYAPGDEGSALVRVERVTGGALAGASAVGTVLVDGESVWTETKTLDGSGSATFAFSIPSVVERGEGRFTCRISDGSVVETELETFVVPTGRFDVHFYPEGGDLVAELDNRVYVEVFDALGRPASARGSVRDSMGREVARLETAHQGRGRFEFLVQSAIDYTLELEEAPGQRFPLPQSLNRGAVIRTRSDVSPAGEPLALEVLTTDAGPFVAGLFCRGVLVAQDTFQGKGSHELSFPLEEKLAGVMRLTVFDRELNPLAERLVARESSRRIQIELEAAQANVTPGAHQKLTFTARDELGNPTACVLGVAVTDQAVRDYTGEQRVGLADQTWFFADVEALEDISEFTAGDQESRRNVDLVLGTRGWRRFAWVEPKTLLDEHGDKARRLLVREGRPEVPVVEDLAGDGPELVSAARRSARKSENTAQSMGAIGVILLIALLVWNAVRVIPALRGRAVAGHAAGFLVCAMLFFAVPAVLFTDLDKMAPVENAAVLFAPAAEREWEEATGEEAQFFDDLALGVQFGQLDERRKWHEAGPGAAAGAGPGAEPIALGRGLRDAPGSPAGGGGARELMDGLALGQREEEKIGRRFNKHDVGRLERLGYLGGFDGFDPAAERIQPMRVYAHINSRTAGSIRSDFTETVYWNSLLATGPDGRASVEFDVSDRVTTWQVHVDAHGNGRVGQSLDGFRAVPPFHLETKLPVEVTVGDELRIPVAFQTANGQSADALLVCKPSESLMLTGEAQRALRLDGGRGRTFLELEPQQAGVEARLVIAAQCADWKDALDVPVRIVSRGFPQELAQSGVTNGKSEFEIALPESWVDGSLDVDLVFYPSPLSELTQGMDGLLQRPGGCFEQASRSNYPNVMVLTYLQAAGDEINEVQVRAQDLLDSGYGLLTGYECSDLGYEWFGGNPGHEALTAYGLQQFHDMARVYDVDEEMVQRTRQWLLDRRDDNGGYLANPRALDSFGRAPKETTDAYCSYALLTTGTPAASMQQEVEQLAIRAVETDDAYELALCAAALEAAGRKEVAQSARGRLKAMQHEDGSLVGFDTITRSGGTDLAVETTSLAVLAWLDDPECSANVRSGLDFIVSKRHGGGTFGATQATILALKALTRYAESNPKPLVEGEITIFVNDYAVQTIGVDPQQLEPIRIDALSEHLSSGENRIRFESTGDNEIPWSFGIEYFSEFPADAPDAKVGIQTALSAEQVQEGETVSLSVEVHNMTKEGQPMTMAIVGLPAGLEAPTDVLNDLKKGERFDFWEIQGRDLVLYWRDLAPSARETVNIDLLARIPGKTTGPASRVHLYYTPQLERWSEPLSIEVLAAE